MSEIFSKTKNLSGALLLELLVVIGVFAILVPLVAQIIVTSLNVNKISIENMTALNLMDEVINATDSIAYSDWYNIYNLTKNSSTHYYPSQTAGVWTVASGDEVINVGGINYTRYFTVSNVCRDPNVGNNIVSDTSITSCVFPIADDPSAQRITITVNWDNRTISKNTYLLRWRNKVCYQTDWTGTGTATSSCPSTLYDSGTNIDITTVPGSILIQHN